MSILRCPRCDGTMEAGFVLDAAHYNQPTTQKWVEGPPERSFWSGLKTKDRDMFAVTTYRCDGCGLLESYATEAAKKK
ncbi:MAG TPA: PF20097 family protein [Gemmatimonadaceae bacterium]|nr:PF20097 family protein [Gemmatimonadaceae bacterium]